MPKITKQSKEEKIYEEKYGHLPTDKKSLLSIIEKELKPNMQLVQDEMNRIDSLEWRTVELELPVIPKPSPRPRYDFSTSHFYVMGAQNNKKLIKKYIDDAEIIYTRTILDIITYQPIPMSSMNKNEVYLAELGYLTPMQNPDYDNLAKTYTDMIQGILLLNDNIVTIGKVEKYFSIKPRVLIRIQYQVGFDSTFNYKRITNSTAFINNKNIIPYTDGREGIKNDAND